MKRGGAWPFIPELLVYPYEQKKGAGDEVIDLTSQTISNSNMKQ